MAQHYAATAIRSKSVGICNQAKREKHDDTFRRLMVAVAGQ
jgi:hypothetical protein